MKKKERLATPGLNDVHKGLRLALNHYIVLEI
jgi:hypothetical protein